MKLPGGLSRWQDYYEAVAGRPPRETCLAAIVAWQAEHGHAPTKTAVDLGCGEGRDAVALLQHGFRVIAIDANKAGLDWMAARTDLPACGALEIVHARMEDAHWPACDIVNASFALPFCPPERFPELWNRIVRSLIGGGRFAGQLFGPDDDWANPGLTLMTRDEVVALLAPFDIEQLEEVNRAGKDAKGNAKHWHLFHIVARKR